MKSDIIYLLREEDKALSGLLIILLRFLQFQKGRVDNEKISGASVHNFVKAIKLFCEMADIDIAWKKTTHGLPKTKRYADDRALVEEIRKNL